MSKKKIQVKELTMQQRAAFTVMAVLAMVAGIWALVSMDPTIDNPGIPQNKSPLPIEDRILFQQHMAVEIANISAEKPRASVGSFTITNIDYLSDRIARISYNDGLTYYVGEVDFYVNSKASTPGVDIFGFKIIAEDRGKEPVVDPNIVPRTPEPLPAGGTSELDGLGIGVEVTAVE